MTNDEYFDKWIANIPPDKQLKWKQPGDRNIAFIARQWVIRDIEEEYAAIKIVGHICPIMDLQLARASQ